MRRHHRYGLIFLLGASLAFRLLCVTGSLQALATHGPLYDDSFYAFSVARNISRGAGSSFDGEHLTNGYQPLWVGLLVPLYWLVPGEAPIRVALVLSILFNLATGWVLLQLLRRRVSPGSALLGLALWGFAPAIVQQAANGLETSLALLCVSLALWHYVARVRRRPTRRNAIGLGLLLALAIVARVDALLFAFALAVDMARRRHLWRMGAVAALVGASLLGPWCVASHCFLGASLPESGKAIQLLSLAYAGAGDGASQVPLWAQNLGNSLLLLGTSPALHGFTRLAQRGLETLGLSSAWMGAAAVLVLLAACATVWVTRRQRLRIDDEGLDFLALYCALLLAAYSFVVFGQIFFARYYYPIFFVSILVACDTFEALKARTVGRRRALLWTFAVVYVAFLPAMAWKRTRHRDYRFLNAVQWIEAATPRGARVGVFNGGAIGYFSTRHVINLDGKVNHGALHALQEDRLRVYLRNERIDYVVDHDRVLDRFLFSRPGSAPLHFSRVASEGELGVPGWSAYRVIAQSPGGGSLGEGSLDP